MDETASDEALWNHPVQQPSLQKGVRGVERNCILVVDDELPVARFLKAALTRYGYRVALAQDGMRALELFEVEEPDAVLLDLNLPLKPGWEVYQEMKSARDVPIFITTGNAALGESIRAILGTNDAYFSKPFDVLTLVEQLHSALEA